MIKATILGEIVKIRVINKSELNGYFLLVKGYKDWCITLENRCYLRYKSILKVGNKVLLKGVFEGPSQSIAVRKVYKDEKTLSSQYLEETKDWTKLVSFTGKICSVKFLISIVDVPLVFVKLKGLPETEFCFFDDNEPPKGHKIFKNKKDITIVGEYYHGTPRLNVNKVAKANK
jgi:hypothetical protein